MSRRLMRSFGHLPSQYPKSIASEGRVKGDQLCEHGEQVTAFEQRLSCTTSNPLLKFIQETLRRSERFGSVKSDSAGIIYSPTP